MWRHEKILTVILPGLQFQKRSYANVELFRCGKKGHGLRAMENIPSGTFIIEYVGEVCRCLEFKLCVFCDADRDQKIHRWLVLMDGCLQWITSRDYILRNLRISPSNEKLSHGVIAWACAMCFILSKEPFCLLVGVYFIFPYVWCVNSQITGIWTLVLCYHFPFRCWTCHHLKYGRRNML